MASLLRITVLACCFLTTGAVLADLIFLRSGRVLVGQVLRQDPAAVLVRVKGRTRTISKARIMRIRYGVNRRIRRPGTKKRRIRRPGAKSRRRRGRPQTEQRKSAAGNLSPRWRAALLPGWGHARDGGSTWRRDSLGIFSTFVGLTALAVREGDRVRSLNRNLQRRSRSLLAGASIASPEAGVIAALAERRLRHKTHRRMTRRARLSWAMALAAATTYVYQWHSAGKTGSVRFGFAPGASVQLRSRLHLSK